MAWKNNSARLRAIRANGAYVELEDEKGQKELITRRMALKRAQALVDIRDRLPADKLKVAKAEKMTTQDLIEAFVIAANEARQNDLGEPYASQWVQAVVAGHNSKN